MMTVTNERAPYGMIPTELKECNQWVMWKLITRKGEEKPTKIPYTTQNIEAKSTDSKTWSSFDDCREAHETGLYSGIGYVFSSSDDFLGVDYDNVRDPVIGEIEPDILQEIIDLKSYAEVSQSGRGVHVICKGKKPGDRCRSGCREMYSEGRFFVMTGDHLEGTPTTINYAPTEAIQAVYDKIDSKGKKVGLHEPPSKIVKSQELTDTEVISLCVGAKNADKFEALWDGNTSGHGGDQSRADQAFCDIIAFYTQDPKQIDRLFRESGLYREKWEREDYRDRTIQNAIDGLTATYRRDYSTLNMSKVEEATNGQINEEMRARALEIAETCDPVSYILDTCDGLHVGDSGVKKTLLVSIGIQSVLNSDGIQPKVSGDSGKGKTHCCKAMAHLIPRGWIHETTLSDKAIYYMDPKEGSIIFCDDIDLSEILEGVIKRATSNFQEGTSYTTLDIKRKKETKRIPARLSWWLTSVDDDQSLQLLNRQFGGGVDETPEQDRRVMEFQLERAACGEVGFPETDEVLTCREIIRDIKLSKYIVKIPYARNIIWHDLENRRNLPIFLDIIKSYAVIRHRQRKKDSDGALIADLEDYEAAKVLYTSRAENQGLKLTDAEMRFCIILANRKEATREEIAKALGVTVGRVSHLVFGKNKNSDSGLINKVKGLSVEKRTVETPPGHWTQKTYFCLSGFNAFDIFGSVVSLNTDDTRYYHTDTHTDTSNNNNSRHTDTTNTIKKESYNGLLSNTDDSTCTRKPENRVSVVSAVQPISNSGVSVSVISEVIDSTDCGNSGTADVKNVFERCILWENAHGPINQTNLWMAVQDIGKDLKLPYDDIKKVVEKYAKIAPSRCVDCGSSEIVHRSELLNNQTVYRCQSCWEKYQSLTPVNLPETEVGI